MLSIEVSLEWGSLGNAVKKDIVMVLNTLNKFNSSDFYGSFTSNNCELFQQDERTAGACIFKLLGKDTIVCTTS